MNGPTQFLIPASASGEVTRRLVLQNPLDEALVMKLVVNPENFNRAIRLSHEYIRLPPQKAVDIYAWIDASRLHLAENSISGFVRIQDNHEAAVQWLTTPGAQTEQYRAFSLAISLAEGAPEYTSAVIKLHANVDLGQKLQTGLGNAAVAKAFSGYLAFNEESSYVDSELNTELACQN